nr:reverse transcriptase domain-containing protein [Tanacetum cinerariifolium]
MANTTPIVTTVTKAANKEKTSKEANAALKVNILDLCEVHYEDIFPVIMDKIRHDKQKEVHARLDFGESSKKSQRVREVSQNSSAGTLPARYRNPSEKPKMRDRLRYNDGNVFNRLVPNEEGSSGRDGRVHQLVTRANIDQPGHDDTHLATLVGEHNISEGNVCSYNKIPQVLSFQNVLPNLTKECGLRRSQRSSKLPAGLNNFVLDSKVKYGLNRVCPRSKDHIPGIKESYGNTCSSYSTGARYRYHSHDRDRSRSMKRGRESEYPLSRVSESGTSNGGHWKSKSKYESQQVKKTWQCPGHAKRTAKEILAAKVGKFKPPPPMLKKKIKELVRASKLSHLIKEIKLGRNQPKVGKKEVPAKDKSTKIYMGTEGSLIIEVEIGGHMIHYMYVDGGSSMEVLYEHCFNRLRPEIKSQMVSATTSLTGFSGETIWPLVQLRLLVIIEDAQHSIKAWMNFMIVRSLSPYNSIIRRPRIREIQAVPSTAHRMLKFPVDRGIVTIHSTILIPTECAAVTTTSNEILKEAEVRYENFKVALHSNFPDQESSDMIGVPRSVAEHRLNIWKGYPPIRQKKGARPWNVPEPSNMAIKKWSVMLGEHNITYRPRTYVKGHILLDFLVEKPNEAPPDTSMVETSQEPWTLFTDGSSCVDGSGVGLILTSPKGTEFTYPLRFQFTASNNEAEYKALIAGLWIATQMGVRNVHVSVDSKLVANQVLGTYVAKEENMIKYLEKAKSLVSGFANFSISQVRRSKNKKVDALIKIASTSFAHLSKQVLVEVLKEKSIQEKKEAIKLRIKARQYELLEGVLYKRTFLKPWLKCVGPLQADYVIREIHEGSCTADSHHGYMAILQVGNYIAGPFPVGPGKSGEEVRVGQYSGPLRPSGRNSLGQRSRHTQGNQNANVPHHDSGHVHNDEELRLNLDLLEERREREAIRKAKAKLKMTKYYNARVRGVTFRPGDFVYRSNDASHAVDGGKLGPNWEGPYEVTEALGDRAYRLRLSTLIIAFHVRGLQPQWPWILHLGLCGGIRQQNRQPSKSDGRHEYGDAVRSGVMSGTNPMGAKNHHVLLLFSARHMLAAMASFNSISSLNAQGSLGSHTSGYIGIFSWEELGRRSQIH